MKEQRVVGVRLKIFVRENKPTRPVVWNYRSCLLMATN